MPLDALIVIVVFNGLYYRFYEILLIPEQIQQINDDELSNQ